MMSDLGIFRRRAQRASLAARALSSFTVIVGMVIPRYYHQAAADVPGGVVADAALDAPGGSLHAVPKILRS